MTVRSGVDMGAPASLALSPGVRLGTDETSAAGPVVYPRCRLGAYQFSKQPGFKARGEHPMQVIEVTQSVAVTISVFLRDSMTDAGVAGLASFLAITSKKVGASFSTIAPAATDRGNGWYDLAFTGPMVDTLGLMPLRIVSTTGTGAPACQDCNEYTLKVVPSVVDANVIQVASDATAATNLKNTFNGTGYVDPNAPARQTDLSSAVTTIDGHTDTALASAVSTIDGNTSTVVAAAVTTIDGHTDTALASAVTTIDAHTTTEVSGIAAAPSAATIRDAILDAARSGHVGTGTIGEGVALAAALLQGNFYMDNVTNTANGQTAARIRCFHNGAAATAATYGGSGEGEFATFDVATSYSGVGKIMDHRVVQE